MNEKLIVLDTDMAPDSWMAILLKPTIRTHEYFFWDPLTAAVAADESLATFQQRSLKVIYKEGAQSGRTLEVEGGADIRMCTTVDNTRFERIFLDTLNGRSV